MDKKEFSIVFVPTWSCNCRCDHCFERLISQTIQDDFWHVFFSKLKDYTVHRQLKKIMIYWQGGEVMSMRPENVRAGLEIGRKIFDGGDTVVEHHLQTNLLLYNQQWKEIISNFFSGNISSSLDYPNLYRKASAIAYDDYNAAWMEKKKEAEADGFIVSVVTLPNEKTLERGAAEFYQFFKDDVAVRNLQINFPFPGVNTSQPAKLDTVKLGDFLVDLHRIWIESDRFLNLNPLAAIENKVLKNGGRLSCAWAYSCANFLVAVGPDGEVGQCDCWVSTQKEYSFGYLSENSFEELLQSRKRKPFLDRPVKMIHDPACGECAYWKICYGGCPVRAYTFNGRIDSKDHYCQVYKRLFQAVIDNSI